MSTYLVAFVVSNFKSIKLISTKHQIEVEVAARPEPIENGEGVYALEKAAQILDFFTDYFEVKYPLKKSSMCYLRVLTKTSSQNRSVTYVPNRY